MGSIINGYCSLSQNWIQFRKFWAKFSLCIQEAINLGEVHLTSVLSWGTNSSSSYWFSSFIFSFQRQCNKPNREIHWYWLCENNYMYMIHGSTSDIQMCLRPHSLSELDGSRSLYVFSTIGQGRHAQEESYKAVCDECYGLLPSACYSYTDWLFIPSGMNKEALREDIVFELGLEGWQNFERERTE